MFNTAEIATAHGIADDVLNASLRDRGWDFGKLDMSNAAYVDFAVKVAADTAREIAQRQAEQAANKAKVAARRAAAQTPAAKANPAMACTRCDGKGTLRAFSHIESGKCYGCGGTGVFRARRK